MSDSIFTHGSSHLLPFRRRSRGAHVAAPYYARLLAEVERCDAELAGIVSRRRDAVQQATNLAEHYWPVHEAARGYRPPKGDELALPDILPEAEGLAGRRLRSVLMTLLRRHGACPLPVLHRLLLLHGFFLDSSFYGAAAGFQPRPGRFGAVPLVPVTPWNAVDEDHLPSGAA